MTRRRYTHRILWNAISIEVTDDPDWLNAAETPAEALAHQQIRALSPERAALPVTETGYRSHFLPAAALLEAGGPLAYVRAWLNQEAATKDSRDRQEANRQYALFYAASARPRC